MKPTVFVITVNMTKTDINGEQTIKTKFKNISAIDPGNEAFRFGAIQILNELIDELTKE